MSRAHSETPTSTAMSPALTLLFAISGGAAVGNLYWAQPLLSDIAGSLGVSIAAAGTLITVTQIGYALGILLVVPLGDTMNRRRLIPATMICSAVALIACALAPSFPALLVALAAVGLTTVAGQLLTPLAGDLAEPDQRGRVVGTIVSGLITGILLSRTISGFLANAFGWRAIYLAAAVFIILLAILLSRGSAGGEAEACRFLWQIVGLSLFGRASTSACANYAHHRCLRICRLHTFLDRADLSSQFAAFRLFSQPDRSGRPCWSCGRACSSSCWLAP
jgi:predicted MFS family arabinose efflux permease